MKVFKTGLAEPWGLTEAPRPEDGPGAQTLPPSGAPVAVGQARHPRRPFEEGPGSGEPAGHGGDPSEQLRARVGLPNLTRHGRSRGQFSIMDLCVPVLRRTELRAGQTPALATPSVRLLVATYAESPISRDVTCREWGLRRSRELAGTRGPRVQIPDAPRPFAEMLGGSHGCQADAPLRGESFSL